MKVEMPFDVLKVQLSPPRTGSFGGIRLYMTELIAITQTALQSQSWKVKAQGAAAMATVAREQTGSLVAPHLGMVLTALLQGLSGRTWAGKVPHRQRRARKRKLLLFHTASFCLCFSGGAVEGHRIGGRQMQVSVLGDIYYSMLYIMYYTSKLMFHIILLIRNDYIILHYCNYYYSYYYYYYFT